MAQRGRFHGEPAPFSVAELLASQKRIRRQPPEPQIYVGDLLEREQAARQAAEPEPAEAVPARGRRRTPLLLAAAVAAVLAAALVATNLLANQHGQDPAGTAAEGITGAKVFRPDAIKASLGGGNAGRPGGTAGGGQSPLGPGSQPVQTAGSLPGSDLTGGDPGAGQGGGPNGHGAGGEQGGVGAAGDAGAGGGTETAGPDSGGPTTAATTTTGATIAGPTSPATTTGASPVLPAPGTGPVLDTILAFYAAAPSQPAVAYQLLDQSLQDGTVEDFAASWQGIAAAVVTSATPAGPHTMVVTVQLRRTDGSVMTITERITVRVGAKPKIVAAELLSASAG